MMFRLSRIEVLAAALQETWIECQHSASEAEREGRAKDVEKIRRELFGACYAAGIEPPSCVFLPQCQHKEK